MKKIFFLLSLVCISLPSYAKSKTEVATFGGGCFWCMEPPFDKLKGVQSTTSGYMGGFKKDPKYEEVSSGTTGHAEVVQVAFDPSKITYKELVEIFWRSHNPTDDGGQFADRGNQYRTAIFYHGKEQKKVAEASKKALDASKKFSKPIATEITEATRFYPAEDYHQDYYKKNPDNYKRYRIGSGRDDFIRRNWPEKP